MNRMSNRQLLLQLPNPTLLYLTLVIIFTFDSISAKTPSQLLSPPPPPSSSGDWLALFLQVCSTPLRSAITDTRRSARCSDAESFNKLFLRLGRDSFVTSIRSSVSATMQRSSLPSPVVSTMVKISGEGDGQACAT
jgi:hypothetical protein